MTTDSTIIVEHFPAPKKPFTSQTVPPASWCGHKQQQQISYHGAGSVSHLPVKTEKERADKANLTLEEYRKRVNAVLVASNSCPFQTGDTVYPTNSKDFEKYGQCQIVGIVRHFDDYGTVEWHEPPFILTLRSKKSPGTTLNTTVGWASKRIEYTLEGSDC